MLLRTLPALLLLAAASSIGCASGGIPADASTTVLSFKDLDCSDCGDDMARTLIKVEGVYKTAFNKRKAELTVLADPELDVFSLAQKNKPAKEEWQLVKGAGNGGYRAWSVTPPGSDVIEVAKDGEDVPDLAPHLAKDKVTVVDFSAKWCEPCRELDAHVLELMKTRTDLAYRKLDVGDWDTPLGQRYMKGIKQLPYVIVFDKAGQRVDAISGLDLPRLDAALDKAGSRKP